MYITVHHGLIVIFADFYLQKLLNLVGKLSEHSESRTVTSTFSGCILLNKIKSISKEFVVHSMNDLRTSERDFLPNSSK